MDFKNPVTHKISDPWRNFKDGDFDSLGLLFEKHYLELFYYGNKIVALPELVKDTIQDLFIDVWERRREMTAVENIKAYLIISLRHELVRRMQKLRKEGSSDRDSQNQFSFSPEDFVILDEQNQEHTLRLSRSLSGLTERQREVILLRFYHNLEFPEISQALEMNVQSVRNLLFRALEKIRKDMSDQGVTGLESVEMLLWFAFGKNK